jgi:hypothetical protein
VGEIRRIPQVIVQEVALGGVISGVAPDGVDSLETLYRGRYRKWTACTVAGLFAIPATFASGWGTERILWNAPGCGGITINLIDDDGFVYPVHTSLAASGSWVPPDDIMKVLPGWSVQVVGANPLGATGRVVMFVGAGWGQSALDGAPILGDEQCPPKIQYTP